jgi:hypothetical protein
LKGLLAAVNAEELVLDHVEAAELDDWDTPEDAALAQRRGRRHPSSS